MKMQRIWMLSAGMTLLAGILLGQGTHPAPTFEVASIKSAPPFSLEKMMSGQVHVGKISGSRVDFGFVSLLDLLAYAYRVKPYQISGPAWMRDGRWDIDAKRPEGESQDRVPEMVLSLLIERFKLTAHHESRENPVYELVVDQGGPKLKESPPEDPPAESTDPDKNTGGSTFSLGGGLGGGGMRMNNSGAGALIRDGPNGDTRVSQTATGGMRMEMSMMTLAALAGLLTPFLDRPVVDNTGLKGTYQVALELPSDAILRMLQNQAGAANVQSVFAQWGGAGFGTGRGWTGNQGGADAGSSAAASDPAGPSVFQAVQQLGLKLQKGKAPIDTVVIDHLEKAPSEN
jgi:uncharacterized protein (TIGR03435 family)